jgi:hypothetical protein
MNIDLPELIRTLCPELVEQEDVAFGRTWSLIAWRGRVLGIRRQSRDLLGPFESAYQVVTELGERVSPEKGDEPAELWLWDGRRFTVDHEHRTVAAFDRGGVGPLSHRAWRVLRGKTFIIAGPGGTA